MFGNQRFILFALALSSIFCHAMEQDREIEVHNAVSFIYYPSTHRWIGAGHAEIEEDGLSWSLLGDVSLCSNRTLDEMIEKSTSDGMPFFRFVFKAEDAQIAAVQDAIDPLNGSFPCTHGALAPLAKAKICSVPLPFSLSPLLTAGYLTLGKTLGLNNVAHIEYYGNPSLRKSIAKMSVGALQETAYIGLIPYGIWLAFQKQEDLSQQI